VKPWATVGTPSTDAAIATAIRKVERRDIWLSRIAASLDRVLCRLDGEPRDIAFYSAISLRGAHQLSLKARNGEPKGGAYDGRAVLVPQPADLAVQPSKLV
jgi:hypothetical protein